MKNLKRVLAAALCLLLSLALFAGCGKQEAPAPAAAATEAPKAEPAPTEAPKAEPTGEPAAKPANSQGNGEKKPQRAGSLVAPTNPLVGPIELPELFTDGMYRRVANADQMKGEGRIVYSNGTLSVWAYGAAGAEDLVLDFVGADEPLHYFFESIGANSSFSVDGGKVKALILRPPTFGTTERNASLLTEDFLTNVRVTVACNPTQSPDGGAVTPTDTTVIVSDTLSQLYLDLRGDTQADAANAPGIVLDGDGKLDFSGAAAGDTAAFSAAGDNGQRTFTVTYNGDGTVSFFYTVG